MKKSAQSVFLVFVALTVLLNGCVPASTPIPPTFTPSPILPTATTTPMPEGKIFFDDFSSQTNTNTKWYESGKIKDGEIYPNLYILGGSNSWKNYSVRAIVRLISGEIDFGTVARFIDDYHYYTCQFSYDKSWLAILGDNLARGNVDYLIMNLNDGLSLGKSYEVRMDVQDNVITCLLDGVVFATATDFTYPSGKFGFRVINTKAAIDNVEVYELP